MNSKLHYFGARYYDAELGRFITPDPVSGGSGKIDLINPERLHPYVYCANNSLKFVDPSGMWFMHVYVDPETRSTYVQLVDRSGQVRHTMTGLAEGQGRNRMNLNADTPYGMYRITDIERQSRTDVGCVMMHSEIERMEAQRREYRKILTERGQEVD